MIAPSQCRVRPRQSRLPRILTILSALATCGPACAHQVPSLTVEASFASDRSYTLKVNIDPRLVISDQPSSMPPVPIEWYREQSPDELQATIQKASEYLKDALVIQFGDASVPVLNCEFQPMDGATNMPLSPDTREVHLLATAKGAVPQSRTSFALTLKPSAGVSMILLNSFEGTMERRPNVVFPGETSRPFELNFPARVNDTENSPAAGSASPTEPPGTHSPLTTRLALGGAVLLALAAAAYALLRRR